MVNETVIQKDLIVNGLGSFGDREADNPTQIANDLEVVSSTGDVSFGIIAKSGNSSILNFGDADSNDVGKLVFDHASNELTITATTTTILGDLTVSGTTTTVNSANLNITDNVILLNKDEVGPGVTLGIAGIEIERGSETDNAGWFFNELEDWWGPTGPAGILGVGGATQVIGNVAAINSSDSTDGILTLNAGAGGGAVLVPIATTVQRDAITAINGMFLYNSIANKYQARENGAWIEFSTGVPGVGFLSLAGGTITGDLSMGTGTQFLADFGTALAPGIAFLGDDNTGLFRISNNVLGIATEGVLRIQTGTTVSDFFVDIDLNGNTLSGVADPVLGDEVGDRDFNDGRYLERDGSGTITGVLLPDGDGTRDLGSIAATFNTVHAVTFEGQATSALYADLAERYAADMELESGTVVIFGGEAEITESYFEFDTAVAGVISTNPAYMMNSEVGSDTTHPYVALRGKVPCKVIGPIKKGDLIVTSDIHGYGKSAGKHSIAYTVFARALEDNNDNEKIIIMVSII